MAQFPAQTISSRPPLPVWGTGWGLVFVAAMALTPLGIAVGYFASFGFAILSVPGILLFGGTKSVPLFGIVAGAIVALLILGKQATIYFCTTDDKRRLHELNVLVLNVLLTGGVVISVFAMQQAWR